MSQISLCMIVRDEADRLSTCLASVQPLVEELIVVDTGSTDNTVEIAQNLGCQVFHFPWSNDFSQARNYSLQQASKDWVLVLDADETLTPEAIPLIQQIIQGNYPTVETDRPALVVNLTRLEVGANQAPYSLVSRLFRRHPAIQFTRPYHELIDDSVEQLVQQEPQWRILTLPVVAILHAGYQADEIAKRQKFDRMKTILEDFLQTHPHDAYVCSKLGGLYVQTGELDRAMTWLEKGLASQPSNAAILYELHYHLGLAYQKAHNLSQAEYHYRRAIATGILPRLKIGAYQNLGNLLQDQQNFSAAIALYENLLTADATLALAHFNVGTLYKATGNFTGAIASYQKALTLDPTYAPAYQNLGVVFLKIGLVPDSLAAFHQAIALYRQCRSPEADRLERAIADMGLA